LLPRRSPCEVSGALDADRQCGTPILNHETLKANVTDEAAYVDDPSMLLVFDEANGGFRLGSCERRCWVERAALSLDDFPVLPQ
jgi:hypothetical protein